MSKFFRLVVCVIACIVLQLAYAENCPTKVSMPVFSSGFSVGGSWLYLQPAPSDGDLEYGSLITLTDMPPNLSAILLEIEPDYHSAFRLNFGYQLPCSNTSLNLSYFQFNATDQDATDIVKFNQFIQNFLGASYATSNAADCQQIHQVDLSVQKHFIIDDQLDINPYLGVRYADIRRNLDVKYTDLVLNPFPSDLTGSERSKFWGIGPVIGTDFSYPLFDCFSIRGRIAGGLLFGNTDSDVNATSIRDGIEETFFSDNSIFRAAPVINSDLALVYSCPLFCTGLSIELTVGYEVDYYFDIIERIDPFNGFVNNLNTFPIKQASNLGLGGPFILLSLIKSPFNCSSKDVSYSASLGDNFFTGLYGGFTSYWLKPIPTDKDLTYATLNSDDGSSRDIQTFPGFGWAGGFDLGYRCRNNLDFRMRYFHLGTSDTSSVTAGLGQGISSINASGPSDVSFSSANSYVRYRIDQYDFLAGKSMQLACRLNFLTNFGLRYMSLNRTMHNDFLGGFPPLTTETKFPILKSNFGGLGPIFGIEPRVAITKNLQLTGLVNLALLVGNIKSTLDQNNFGDLGDSSNNVRTPRTRVIVPALDAKVGLTYSCRLSNCLKVDVEAGYQFTEYYRAINLLFPTLLTGLEQINSNLALSGPFVSININGF